MPSLGQTIHDVIEWIIAAFTNLFFFCFCLAVLVGVGWCVGQVGAWADREFLHWRWPGSYWNEISIYGVFGWFVLAMLAPVVIETLLLLLQCACVLAVILGIVALWAHLPFIPLVLNVAVWFFPCVFVLWLARCTVARFRGGV